MAKSKSQKKQSKQQGGAGAAENAINVFGNTNDQRAVSDIDNTIAMKSPMMNGGKGWLQDIFGSSPSQEPSPVDPSYNVVENNNGMMPPRFGGKQSKQQLQKTIKKQLKQLKQQGGSPLSFSEYSSVPQSAVAPQEATESFAKIAIAPTVLAASAAMGASQNGGEGPMPLDLQKGFLKAGSKMSKQQLQQLNQQLDKLQKQQQQQQGGVGMSEIVVPLVLLYASQKYAQGKTAKMTTKPMSKSMRKSRRFSK